MLHSLQMQERRGGGKNPKSIQPGDFLSRSSCLPQFIRILHKTKPPPTQRNETSKQASKQCAQKGFKLSLQFYPREITPVHHPTNPREISLECLIHFSIFGLPQKNSASKIPIPLSALALNKNPKSSYSRYVEIHLMGIRILAGRRRKAAKTKAIRLELPHPDRQKERNPEQRLFRVGRMFGALGGWSGLQVQ